MSNIPVQKRRPRSEEQIDETIDEFLPRQRPALLLPHRPLRRPAPGRKTEPVVETAKRKKTADGRRRRRQKKDDKE